MSATTPANGESHFEKILRAMIDRTEYPDEPTSVMEVLLLELKESYESGGGGGTTDYNQLHNLPSIGGKTLQGNMSPEDVGAQEEMDSMTSEEIASLWDD